MVDFLREMAYAVGRSPPKTTMAPKKSPKTSQGEQPRPTRQKKATRGQPPQDASTFQERIAKRAFELYEQRGQQDGHALEDWLQAERELRGPW